MNENWLQECSYYTCINRDTVDKEAVWCNIQDIYDMILQCCLEYFKDNIE